MGKARAISIATRTFDKVGDAKTFFGQMLNRYSLGEKVSQEDAADLIALMDRHNEKGEKIGSGISYFSVSQAPDYPDQRCFWITRSDGTQIDISYHHCLEAKPFN